jgi:hypothetical protein
MIVDWRMAAGIKVTFFEFSAERMGRKRIVRREQRIGIRQSGNKATRGGGECGARALKNLRKAELIVIPYEPNYRTNVRLMQGLENGIAMPLTSSDLANFKTPF